MAAFVGGDPLYLAGRGRRLVEVVADRFSGQSAGGRQTDHAPAASSAKWLGSLYNRVIVDDLLVDIEPASIRSKAKPWIVSRLTIVVNSG